jgi:hypothetical protein
VVGYSVAVRPPRGESPVWFGGGSLARDLTLPRLRQEWTDPPQAAEAAAAEWAAAKRGRRPVAPRREAVEVDPALWQQCAAEVRDMREWLRTVPATDHATWARVATETSGAFAAWSARVESAPGPLAEADPSAEIEVDMQRAELNHAVTGVADHEAAEARLLAEAAGGGGRPPTRLRVELR